ncbi:hypothetical protein Hanom_Chr09g00836261 [Helianthus anomalus]
MILERLPHLSRSGCLFEQSRSIIGCSIQWFVSFFGSTGTDTSSMQTNMKKMEEEEAMFGLLVFGCIIR